MVTFSCFGFGPFGNPAPHNITKLHNLNLYLISLTDKYIYFRFMCISVIIKSKTGGHMDNSCLNMKGKTSKSRISTLLGKSENVGLNFKPCEKREN